MRQFPPPETVSGMGSGILLKTLSTSVRSSYTEHVMFRDD